jgi:hypothetical protein
MKCLRQFWSGVKHTKYELGGQQFGIAGDCGDLVAWFSTQVMGYRIDTMGEYSLSIARKMLDEWKRAPKGFASMDQNPFYHTMGDLLVLRWPALAYSSVSNASHFTMRHVMVLIPLQGSVWAMDLSAATNVTLVPAEISLNRVLRVQASLGTFDHLDFDGTLMPGSGLIEPGRMRATIIPMPGRH